MTKMDLLSLQLQLVSLKPGGGRMIFHVLFCSCDLETDQMTSTYELYLSFCKTHAQTNNKLSRSMLLKVIILHTSRHDWKHVHVPCSFAGGKISAQLINKTSTQQLNIPSAENLLTASDSVRKFPVDLDICNNDKQLLQTTTTNQLKATHNVNTAAVTSPIIYEFKTQRHDKHFRWYETSIWSNTGRLVTTSHTQCRMAAKTDISVHAWYLRPFQSWEEDVH